MSAAHQSADRYAAAGASPGGAMAVPGPRPRRSPRPVTMAAGVFTLVAATATLAPLPGPMSPNRVLAQGRGEQAASDKQRELEARKGALEQTRQRARSLEADIATLRQEREQLNRRLVETAALIQKSEGQLTGIEARLGELEAQDKIVRGSLAQRHDQIARLLAAMQRMGRNPPPVIITKREDALEMVRSAMLLARAFPGLRQQAEELASRLSEVVRVLTDIKSERDKLQSETQRLNEARVQLAALMDTKRQSVAERQKELDDVRRTATEISQGVSDLSQLIAKLDKVVAEKTDLGRYEQQQAADTAATAATDAAAAAAATVADAQPKATAAPDANSAAATSPAATTGTKLAAALPPPRPAVELAPVGRLDANPGRLAPAVPFQLAKAQLPQPAQGRRVIGYGERTQYGGQSKGIVIETRNSAQITSPCDGWIVYAGPFRSYGQLLIINAGNGYHVLLAGMSQIDVQLGQFVLASEPVGTMGAAPKSATQDNAPVLYVEFRKEGRPIDPEPWWAAGGRRVQG